MKCWACRFLVLLPFLAAPAAAQQPVFPRHAAAPRACNGASRGHAYLNTTSGKPFVCDGTSWIDITLTGSGVGAGDSVDWTGTHTFLDGNFALIGSADGTKRVRLEVDGLTTGQTRVITPPDANTSLPIASQTLTFTGPTAARTITLPDSSFSVAGLGTANAFTSTNSFTDGSLSILGSGDPTKIVKLEADGCPTGTACTATVTADTTVPIASQPITITGPTAPRSYAFPDADETMCTLGQPQTFTAATVASGVWAFGTGADATSGIELNETAGQITFRGAEPDTAEHRFTAVVNAGFDTLTSVPAAGATQTVALLEATQTFTGIITNTNTIRATGAGGFQPSGGSGNGSIVQSTPQTPDTMVIATGATPNAIHVMEIADVGFNFNNADCAGVACTHPHWVVHSANQNVDQFISIFHDATQPIVRTAGNANGRPVGLHGGTAVASAGTITPTGNVFHVTGTTTITAITALGAGTQMCMIFDGVLTVTDDNGALNLAGNFVTTSNDVLCMASDGTNWYETSRSVN